MTGTGAAMRAACAFLLALLSATLAGCANDPQTQQALQEFGDYLAGVNARWAAAQQQTNAQQIQVQPIVVPQVPQQTFCNQSGNMVTCNGPGLQQTFCNRNGNTITCQ